MWQRSMVRGAWSEERRIGMSDGMAEERQVDMVINDLPITPVPDQIRAGHPLGCV
jgi:hypothetical protein